MSGRPLRTRPLSHSGFYKIWRFDLIDDQYYFLEAVIIIDEGQNIAIVYEPELGGNDGGSIDGSDSDPELLSTSENARETGSGVRRGGS